MNSLNQPLISHDSLKERTDLLHALDVSVGNLKDIAIQMGEEIDNQNTLLNDFDFDNINNTIERNTNTLKKLKKSNKKCTCIFYLCIIFLIIVIVVLILIILNTRY